MRKIIVTTMLSLCALYGVSAVQAATANATVILVNATVASPGVSEYASMMVAGNRYNVGAQGQMTVGVTAGRTFVMNVDNIIFQGGSVNRRNYPGCAAGINVTLKPGERAILTMNANTNPVNGNSIYSCTYSR